MHISLLFPHLQELQKSVHVNKDMQTRLFYHLNIKHHLVNYSFYFL